MQKSIIYNPQDLKLNSRLYRFYHEKNWHDGWEEEEKSANFKQLIKIASLAGKTLPYSSCLDVGCGTGDFIPVLKKKGVKTYTGIDIYGPSLKLAQIKYPMEKFIHADFLAYRMRRKYDYVFCSGTLSTRLKSDNYHIMEAMIRKMINTAKKGVAFNFLTQEEKNQYDESLFFYGVTAVRTLCKKIAPKAKLKTSYIRVGEYYEFRQATIFLYGKIK